MAEYLSQKELVKAIETNLDNLEAGQLNLSEIEEHLNLIRELYERTIVFRYKAFERHSSVEVALPPVAAEEIIPVIEAQEAHKEEEDIPETDFLENIEFKTEEEHSEIEFDFFSSNKDTEEKIREEEDAFISDIQKAEDIKWQDEEIVEEGIISSEIDTSLSSETSETLPSEDEPVQSDFKKRVFEIQREISNQIGFDSLPTLIGSFGLNERLLYINELFDGSSESFSDTIKHLDNRSDLSEAATYIEEIRGKFNWDIESETVEEFIQKLCRRYT